MDQRWIRILKILLIVCASYVTGMERGEIELLEREPLKRDICAEYRITINPEQPKIPAHTFFEKLPVEIWQKYILTKVPKNHHAWYWCACYQGAWPHDTQEFAQLITQKSLDQESSYKKFKDRLKMCAAFTTAKHKTIRSDLKKALADELALWKEKSQTWKRSITVSDQPSFNNCLNALFESHIRAQWNVPADMAVILPVPNNSSCRSFNTDFINHVKQQLTEKPESEKINQIKQWQFIIERLKKYNAYPRELGINIALASGAVINLVSAVGITGLYTNSTALIWWYLSQAFLYTGIFLGKTVYDIGNSSSNFSTSKNFREKLDNCESLLNHLIETIETKAT